MPSFRKPLRLDTWELMNGDFLDPLQASPARSFRIDDGAMVFCEPNQKSSHIGSFVLTMDWSDRKGPSGFLVISYPTWNTLPRIVLLAGVPDKMVGLRWRFLCPISRKLVQLVFFDKGSQLFVSRGALGRPQRKSDFRRIFRYLGQKLELEEKYSDASNKPAEKIAERFDLLKDGLDQLDMLFQLAASGVANPMFRHDGWFDMLAMGRAPIGKPGKAHYRDKAGGLRLSARSKKRLGI